MEQTRASGASATFGTTTGCVVCGLDQDANQILLCDGCDAEYHIYCLVPPLKEIPEGDFYCKSCKDAKRHLAGKHAVAENGPTQAGFTVQDEQGRMVPVRSEDVRESKYKGVLKLLHKGAKKPFVARIQKDTKFLQLGLFSSEIEAAHAYDKAAIQMFGRNAQLNFPHLHDGFVRAASAAETTTTAATTTTATPSRPQVVSSAASSAAASMTSPSFTTSGRGRGRGRGRGSGGRGSRGGATAGGGGRGKRRLEDSPVRDQSTASSSDATSNSAVKKRKALAAATAGDATADTPITTGPKYLGVQVFRGYAHAQITVNGKIVNLGTFPTAVDAATAYDKAALKYFGGDMGAKDAQHDRIVLNFPNKRAELLKQLIEENMHQKARQASGASAHAGTGATTSANRSMQSAKHNLSIKKLENWVLKLQRSVKLVEAAHRVQWDGLPLVKPEEQNAEEEAEGQEHDIKLELLVGAGPTIKTDFTKKQQRLRSGAADIQDAVNLMIQELKIYADDTPVDAAFIPPPRSHALLDLMSTSRFLKLCSTINELAHFEMTSKSGDIGKLPGPEEASADESFEALVQTVVDYRARLQMAASSEKQKLASIVDSESTSPGSPNANDQGAASTGVTPNATDGGVDVLSRETLRNAKYVKRKVQRIRKVTKVLEVHEPVAEQEEEEKKGEIAENATAEEPKSDAEEKEQAPLESESMEVEGESVTAAIDAIVKPAADADNYSVSKTEDVKEVEGAAVEAVADTAKVTEDVTMVDENDTEPAPEDTTGSNVPTVPSTDSTEKSHADEELKEPTEEQPQATESSTADLPTESSDEPAAAVSGDVDEKVPDADSSAPSQVSQATVEVAPTADADQDMEDVSPEAESKESKPVDDATEEPTPIVLESAIVVSEPIEEEETVVEEEWEYCLALKPQQSSNRTATEKDGLWRLLPLQSESGEFVENVFLTDDEVTEIEVPESEVCSIAHRAESKTSDSKAPTPPLVELHKNEVVLRERVKVETDRRSALEGVIKIEQERLSQVFVVYRRMLEGITVKAGDAQKKHQRITRDLLLVELMKQTFAPILDELLEQCDSVFLQRLEKLSDRYEDFQQEFDYYTDALVSVAGSSSGTQAETQENGHLKDEVEPVSEHVRAADMNGDDDEDSSGLRDAYVSFYMEEIEALWKERCRAVESLYAIMRSLTVGASEKAPVEGDDAPEVVEAPTSATLLRRRVAENLEQWKSVVWPTQLATPSFMTSFMSDSANRGAAATTHLALSNQPERNPVNTALGELKQIIIDLTQESPTSVTTRVVRHSTLVVYHPVFLEHQTPKDHPECPERLNRIVTMLNTLRKKYDDALKIDRLTQSPEELSPSESILLAVHSPAYLQQLKDRSKEASTATETTSRGTLPLPSSALVFETNRGAVDLPAAGLSGARASPTGSMGGAFGASNVFPTGIAMDTYVSSKSWDVARAAAGTVCLAVDRVVRKEFRNAACLVRPPGHHVGRHGRTLDAPSSGFCLLNNVVIGAVHARQYPWIRRIAVLDWDIHHGNGTEELMRDDPDGFFASVHLYASGKYFPGTGKGEQGENLVNVALENTGAGSGSTAFRTALEEQILPAMRAFRPDIIFISAGFDGHKDDILGGRAAVKNSAIPAGYLEDDYVWATQEVLKLADECCDGRVISVLEGGYDVRKETNSLAKSVAAHVGAIASYEQEKHQKQTSEVDNAVIANENIKTESSTGVLLSLLSKDLNDSDVIIIDDDDDDEEDTADKTGLLANGDVDVDDEDEELDDGDEDVDGDGVEVDEEDDGVHGESHHDGEDLDEDVVMTDEDHDGHSVDDDDADAHSTGLSFAASLSVDGEDDDAHHSQEDLDGGDVVMAPQVSRIETPDYDHLDGNGDEEGDDDMMGGHGNNHDDDDDDHGDLLGDEDHDSAGELPSLS